MKFFVAFLAAAICCTAVSAELKYVLYYTIDGCTATGTYIVNENDKTIIQTIQNCDEVYSSETIMDFNNKIEAERDDEDDNCIVRQLTRKYEDALQYISSLNGTDLALTRSSMDIIPRDSVDHELAEPIKAFCGERDIFYANANGATVDVKEKEIKDQEDRQVVANFTRCRIWCFIWQCFTTTITIPTGTQILIPFFWFLG